MAYFLDSIPEISQCKDTRPQAITQSPIVGISAILHPEPVGINPKVSQIKARMLIFADYFGGIQSTFGPCESNTTFYNHY